MSFGDHDDFIDFVACMVAILFLDLVAGIPYCQGLYVAVDRFLQWWHYSGAAKTGRWRDRVVFVVAIDRFSERIGCAFSKIPYSKCIKHVRSRLPCLSLAERRWRST